MATKEEMLLWDSAVQEYKAGNLKQALKGMREIGTYSKVQFNIGMIYLKAKDYDSSEVMFSQATATDPFMAIGLVQQGYSLFMLYEYEGADKCFRKAYELLRENNYIDYEQLGLKHKLHRCEVLFNMAMCLQQLGNEREATQYISEAQKLAETPDQKNIIGSSGRRGLENLTLFTVPLSCIFEIPESKLKNLGKKDFLNSAKLVVDTDGGQDQGFIGFSGATMLDPSIENNAGGTLVRKKSAPGPTAAPIPPPSSAPIPRSQPAKSLNRNDSGRGQASPVSTKIASRKASLIAPRSTTRANPEVRKPGNISPKTGNDSGYDDGQGSLKIKVHTEKSTVIVFSSKNTNLKALSDLIQNKLKRPSAVSLCFIDDDDPDTMISICDEDDLQLALSVDSSIVHLYIQEKDHVLDFY